jgi:hypothetical protein
MLAISASPPRRRLPAALGLLVVLALSARVLAECPPEFQRADSDANGALEITDAVYILSYLFLGEEPPPCLDAADANDDGALNVADPIWILLFLFSGGPPPPPPHGACGEDLTEDALGCDRYPPCGTDTPDEVERVFGTFHILDTLAGSGAVGIGINGWQAGFEGGPATEADLSAPHIALGDEAGNIYIADKEAHAIRKVTPEGEIFTVAGMNSPGDDGDDPGPGTQRHLDEPNGLWVSADGTVYILDTGNQKVRRLAADGELTTLFEVPGLRTGRGLWVSDGEDLAYVASREELKRWTPGGGLETYAGNFRQLGNLAVDREGDVIVTDRDAHRVYRITADRQVVPIAGNGSTLGGGDGQPALETGLIQPRGVWPLGNGGFFVATQTGSRVWYVDTQGTIHLFLDGVPGNVRAGDGEPFDTPGPKISNVRSVTMDRQGSLLVTENDFGFVRIVEYFPPPPCG